jgi:hypothetical protein
VATRIQRTGLIDRRVQRRDARIFVIATEGTDTEPAYFRGLQEREIIDRSRVRIEVIATPREDGTSAPRHVLRRLDAFAARYRLLDGLDELWLVVDVDRWPAPQLSEVAQEATQKGFGLAVSNPCFELWLLLHVAEAPAAIGTCGDCEAEIRRVVGAYSKTRLDLGVFAVRAAVEAAIARARALDVDESSRWPHATGSQVHRLATRLLEGRG